MLLAWKEKNDARYLYATAFIYGLSSGNHAIVGFFLPAIVFLYFFWKREQAPGSIAVCIALFLVGFSVYAYLPIRSYTEPSFDWGNPETLQGFLYQVTDRKDANVHFSVFDATARSDNALYAFFSGVWSAIRFFFLDVWNRLSPFVAIGVLGGGWLCFKKNKTLFVFFAWIIGINAAFFKGWGGESFFPAYISSCLLSSLFMAGIFRKISSGQSVLLNSLLPVGSPSNEIAGSKKTDWKRLGLIGLSVWIAYSAAMNYPRVDRSQSYSGETLLKPVFLSLENDSIFLAGISWFQFFYHNDVERLRDDVTGVRVWDFLESYPPSWITSRRFPELSIPDVKDHSFGSRQEGWNFFQEFVRLNHEKRPILTDQNIQLFDQFPMAEHFIPYKNVLLKYSDRDAEYNNGNNEAFEEFRRIIKREASQPGILFQKNWINKIAYYVPSFAEYFKSRNLLEEEEQALRLMYEFLGQRGPNWHKAMYRNLLARGLADLAEKHWKALNRDFPETYEFYIVNAWRQISNAKLNSALQSFRLASAIQPENFEPNLELAKAGIKSRKWEIAEIELKKARLKVTGLKELARVEKIQSTSKKAKNKQKN